VKRIFSIGKGGQVPDGTKVFPLLNCRDCTSSLPADLLEDFSLAVGEIEPHRHSKIHVMPLVTQVTFVLRGELEAWMKDGDQPAPYSLRLGAEQAILTRPGTFLQLRNPMPAPCRVLYMVSPSYVFLMEEGRVIYDDSVVLEEDWEALEGINWKPGALRSLDSIRAARDLAQKRFVAPSRQASS
jgi:hypothetical protein